MPQQKSGKEDLATRLTRRVTSFAKRRAIKTRNLIPTISLLRLKDHYDLPHGDATNDPRVRDAVDRYFSWTTGSLPAEDRQFLRWLASDPYSQVGRKAYYEVQYWLRSDTDDGPAIAAKYRQLYDEDINKLEEGAILAYHGHYRKRFRQARKEYLRRVEVRPSLSLKDLAYAVPIVSVLIPLGGYFYTSRVFQHFGIQIRHFFTVTDYLAASVHSVGSAAVSAAIAVVAALWQAVRESTRTDYERQESDKTDRWLWRFSLVLSIYFLWSADQEMRATAIVVLPLTFAGVAIVSTVLTRILRPSVALLLTALSAVVFSALLYVESNRQVLNIERGVEEQSFRVETHDMAFTSDTHSIVGSSEKYMFLWQREDKHVEIVPHTEIKKVSVFRKDE